MKNIALEMAKNSMAIETKAVSDMAPVLDMDCYKKAVDAIVKAKRVITSASGSSGIAAEKFAHTLCCVERPAQFLSPAYALHGGLGAVTDEDVVVIVSRGGKTSELMPVLDVALKKGATVIGVTEKMDSPIGRKSHIVLPLIIEKESDKYNMQATASFVATIALFDSIICAVMEENNYRMEQFALIHPGGAVGERLNK